MPSDQQEAIDEALSREWFYAFPLPGGQTTPTYLADQAIHLTRLEMMDAAIEEHLGQEVRGRTCVDLACHEGFFAAHLAERGFARVLGVDIREENVQGARLISQAKGLTNLQVERRDVFAVDPVSTGTFDVVLMLGLLYHLDNPIGALRVARSVCNGLCLVETVIGPELTGTVDWGSATYTKGIVGAFAVIDEEEDARIGNREANVTAISLVPSLDGLLFAMRAVGFHDVTVVAPPPGAHEQLASGRRALVAGVVA